MSRGGRFLPTGTAREAWLRARSGEVDEQAKDGADRGAATAVDPADFEPAHFGWELARCALARGRALSDPETRVLAALAAACIASMRSGSTRLPLDSVTLPGHLAPWGAAEGVAVARDLLARARSGAPDDPVVTAVGLPGDRKPLIVDGEFLYAERMHVLEARFCERIRERARRGGRVLEGRSLSKVMAAVASGPPALTDEQQRAVREALATPIALVTGGPGTGKTATAVALLRAIAWIGVPMEQIAVAAPTGKAATRLADAIAQGLAQARDLADAGLRAIAPAPLTLHRLLGWSPSRGRFARHENDPMPYRFVVVDEASMIDLAMMDRLVRALRDDARLVLFGDADQLPSIEAGAVFRDLCAGLGAARLTVNLRVASDPTARRITDAARAVNAGATDARLTDAISERRSVDEVKFEGVEHLTSPWAEVGGALLERWWRSQVATDPEFARRAVRVHRLRGGAFDEADRASLRALFDDHARARLLCVTRVGGAPTSADAMNDRLLARLRSATSAGRVSPRGGELWPGAPVSVQRNDYERGLYNGDQGVIVRVAGAGDVDGEEGELSEPQLMAVFPRGAPALDAFPVDAMLDLAPSFAMTVHKAQGSEFDHVAVVLPDADLPLLTRELLYTAMTRARRSVLLVGSPDLLARAVSRTVERSSGVAERLKKGA
jgi:exodeoxyribonuclease V alpha subunit